jgi:DNA mismatch endonuclease (patch repair protein)
MVDIVDSVTRSRMMAGIKSRNTKPELLIRSLLHNRGFRFRLHVKDLPGKPDIVLPKYHSVIFINGCFWHGHENCRLFKLPGTRTEFWQEKIFRNRTNDNRAVDLLRALNWRVCIIWECKIRAAKKDLTPIADIISDFLKGTEPFLELRENSGLITNIIT